MAKQGGFNPDRPGDSARLDPVVPRILDAPAASQASGFTEVKIVGVGGGGGNAVNRMIEADLRGVEFVAVNTDAQALAQSLALHRLRIGPRTGRGLGAGGDPFQGQRAAEDSADELREVLAGSDMVFVTAGMGGGTGTGAAPIVGRPGQGARRPDRGRRHPTLRFRGRPPPPRRRERIARRSASASTP